MQVASATKRLAVQHIVKPKKCTPDSDRNAYNSHLYKLQKKIDRKNKFKTFCYCSKRHANCVDSRANDNDNKEVLCVS